MSSPQWVWLTEHRTYGQLVALYAHYARVRANIGGEVMELDVENDEYELWEEHAIDYFNED